MKILFISEIKGIKLSLRHSQCLLMTQHEDDGHKSKLMMMMMTEIKTQLRKAKTKHHRRLTGDMDGKIIVDINQVFQI